MESYIVVRYYSFVFEIPSSAGVVYQHECYNLDPVKPLKTFVVIYIKTKNKSFRFDRGQRSVCSPVIGLMVDVISPLWYLLCHCSVYNCT